MQAQARRSRRRLPSRRRAAEQRQSRSDDPLTGESLLSGGVYGAVQRDQIRHVEMADRDPASVGLLQYFE
jgi:hypothetical protein